MRPGGALVDGLAERLGLPVAPRGAPLVGAGLAWVTGLYASGGLAELVLGPVARNIHGARHAALRLLRA